MGEWAQQQEFNNHYISSLGLDSVGMQATADGRGFTASTAWPTANLAIYVPFIVATPLTVDQVYLLNQVPSGNVDVGVYEAESWKRLVSSGSVAAAGTNQEVDVTNTLLLPGVYFMAQAVDNTTHTSGSVTPVASVAGSWGVLQQASAFPLPSTATPARMAQAYVPFMSLVMV